MVYFTENSKILWLDDLGSPWVTTWYNYFRNPPFAMFKSLWVLREWCPKQWRSNTIRAIHISWGCIRLRKWFIASVVHGVLGYKLQIRLLDSLRTWRAEWFLTFAGTRALSVCRRCRIQKPIEPWRKYPGRLVILRSFLGILIVIA